MIGLKSIQIQTTTGCTRRCSWCPNKDFFADEEMSLGTLGRVLSNLEGYQGRLHPYLMAEPLCDRRIIRVVKMIRERFPTNVIFIYTNGDHLTRKTAEKLFAAGLDGAAVSIYDDRNPRLADAINAYPERLYPLSGEGLIGTYYNRAGHVDVECKSPRKTCEWLWTKMYINWKGEAILCCSDYEFKVVMGDMKKEHFEDVRKSSKYKAYRSAHIMRRGKRMPLCNRCNRIGNPR